MSPIRDEASSLPPSVEEAYRRKCIALRARMREVEEANDAYRLRRERLARGIRKMRLERAILLETLAKRMNKKGPAVLEAGPGEVFEGDTDDSTDAPPTPQERPMRIKRPHRRTENFGGEGMEQERMGEGTPMRGEREERMGLMPGEGMLGEFGRGEEEERERDGDGDGERRENGRLDGGEDVENGQRAQDQLSRYTAEDREDDAAGGEGDEHMEY